MRIAEGIYPTMITPFDEKGQVDYDAAQELVDWYWRQGCNGIFAVCQSSEMFYLSLEERIQLTACVKKQALRLAEGSGRPPMTIVASGHIAEDIGEQAEELTAIWRAGADAVVLVSNRLDQANRSEQAWIRDGEELLRRLSPDMPLGMYECPRPYKRLLTPEMLRWCVSTGHFCFLKDTCCDRYQIQNRLELLQGSQIQLFNANAQTLLDTLRFGASGYCGIMANFHPQLYCWLWDHYQEPSASVDSAAALMSIAAFTEALRYPATAKYYLRELEGVPIRGYSRGSQPLTDYDRMVMRQLKQLTKQMMQQLEGGH